VFVRPVPDHQDIHQHRFHQVINDLTALCAAIKI